MTKAWLFPLTAEFVQDGLTKFPVGPTSITIGEGNGGPSVAAAGFPRRMELSFLRSYPRPKQMDPSIMIDEDAMAGENGSN